MVFSEEKTFTLRFSLEIRFPEAYDGEEDGYAWWDTWESTMKPALLQAVHATLHQYPSWSVRTRNRGVSSDQEIEFVLTQDLSQPRPEAKR